MLKKTIYTYDDIIKDKLVSIITKDNQDNIIDNMNILYQDLNILNPTTIIKNSLSTSLSWEGRRLMSYGNSIYRYDENGVRVCKETNNLKTKYTVLGSRILHINEDILVSGNTVNKDGHFIYDEHNLLVGLTIDDKEYYYIRDITGNINKIVDTSNTVMIEYTYDAWGKPNISINNELSTSLLEEANIVLELNPYIYKGYCYDSETGLYYLNTRYYDPEVRRFLNADDVSYLDPDSINGLNLYAYCGNNPVMYLDRDGNSPTKWWEWALAGTLVAGLIVGSVLTGGLLGAAFIGASIGGAISLGTQAISGELSWGQFALDIGVGALTGTIGASGISTLGSTIVGTLIGGASSIGSQLIGGKSFDEINWWSVGVSAFIGGAAGFIGGAGARNKGALFNSKSVIKAQNGVSGVVGRFAQGGYYSSARYAQAAFTRTMNALSQEIGSQMTRFFVKTMITYGASTVANNIIMMFI